MNYTYSIEKEDSKYHQGCLYNKTLIENYYDKRSSYEVDCHNNYHHYNARSFERFYKDSAKEVRISNFNMWHPGKSNTKFKDYKLVAAIVNRFDVVAGLELLAPVGEEFSINERVVKVSKPIHLEIVELSKQLDELTDLTEIKALQKVIATKRAYMKDLVHVYKKPGYLKVLEELKKLDASWSLIISSEGEAAKKSDVHELVGFYYRARSVRPEVNPYCKSLLDNKGNPYGCTVKYENSLDRAFSRRPFISSFKSSKFDFMILAAHVVFNSPSNKEEKEFILQNSFGVSSLNELENSVGIDNSTYARFAEVKLTLDLMKNIEDNFDEKDIIYAGDLNLEKSNPFFQKMIDKTSYKAFVDEATSLTERRFVDSIESKGIASNYDHFIFNPNQVTECDGESAKMFNFITDRYMKKRFVDQYIVRRDGAIKDVLYEVNTFAEEIIDTKVELLRNRISKEKKMLRGKIVNRYSSVEVDKMIFEFKNRIFGTQLSNYTYYRFYKELVSDHMPVFIKCSAQ
jgi:hypothetical protein